MALAILQYEQSDGGNHRFRIDIGSNRYYRYAIGKGDTETNEGMPVLLDAVQQSPLYGPLPEHLMGRHFLGVPDKLLDRENRAVQLTSYRTADGAGPMVSEIVRLPRGLPAGGDLPGISFALSQRETPRMTAIVPMEYRERQFSEAQFLQVLTGLLPKVMPFVEKLMPMIGQLAPAIGSLFGGAAKGGGTATAPAVASIEQVLADPQVQALLTTLLGQLKTAAGTPQAATTKSLSLGFARQARESNGHYAQAMVAPALLAALPALMPLLEKVLTPETIKAVLDTVNPEKLIGAVAGGLKELGQIGLKADEQNIKWLEKLNPGVGDAALDKLLEGMSLNLEAAPADPKYRRVSSVQLKVMDLTTHKVAGRERVLYLHGRDLGFSVRVETPRSIPGAELTLTVKDTVSLAVLARKTERIGRLGSGPIAPAPRLERSKLAELKPNHDYLVCITLSWPGRGGQRLGTSVMQMITLLGKSILNRIEEGGVTVPLNDVERHRPYWHKAWQATLNKDEKRYELDCKYYYALAPDRSDNARMETELAVEKEGLWRMRGRLKSGLVLNLPALNSLIPQISNMQPLGESELEALAGDDFVERYNRAARVHVDFDGLPGDSVALWVFPEVRLQPVVLSHAQEATEDGQVRSLAEKTVPFPLPVEAHFVGVKTDR